MTVSARTALDVVLSELAPLGGKSLLDIGCGKGGFCQPLQEAGALWRGLDPLEMSPDLPIDVAAAEAMPYPDNSFDAAVCVRALHHVPVPAMDAALAETARVLRPGGRLVVIEPVATGALSRVIAVVDDETLVRGAAQEAMDRASALVQLRTYDYARTDRHVDFEAFCESLIAIGPGRRDLIGANQDGLRRAFERYARREDGCWTLSQPMSVRVFQTA